MKYGTAPKELDLTQRKSFPRIPRPAYLRPGKDDLNALMDAQETIIEEGVVVLAAVIQANELLFKPGPQDHPGELVLSLDQAIDGQTLAAMAHDLFALKGKECPDEERAEVSNYLANERIRVFGLPVPAQLDRGFRCFCTTTIFRRRSFPAGYLSRKLVPALVHPTSLLAMILPHEYWTPEGRQHYFGRA